MERTIWGLKILMMKDKMEDKELALNKILRINESVTSPLLPQTSFYKTAFYLSEQFIRTFSLLFMDILMARLAISRVDIIIILPIMKLRI